MYNALDSTHNSQWLAAEADFIEVQLSLFQILPPERKEYLNASCCDQLKIVIRTIQDKKITQKSYEPIHLLKF